MSTNALAEGVGVLLRAEYDTYSLDNLRDLSLIAEEAGFDSLWLAESWGHDAISLLSHIGGVTGSIRLGTAVVNVYSRTPALLGMTAATLSDLYNRRFILGLGTSTADLIESCHGIRFESPVTRLAEAVSIIRQATSGEKMSLNGDCFQLDGYRLRVRPRSTPAPIFIAGLGERSMRMAGSIGDGWLPYMLPMQAAEQAMSIIAGAAKAAGRDPSTVVVAPIFITSMSEDPTEARGIARRHIAFYLGSMGDHYRGFVSRFGWAEESAEIAKRWKSGDRESAERAVSPEMLTDLAITGTPSECRDRLQSVKEGPVNLPILFFPKGCSAASVAAALRVLGPERGSPGAVAAERSRRAR